MKIHHHICEKRNIGDEINKWFWKETVGNDALEKYPNSLLVGIGTVLNENLPKADEYHVLGSGFGYDTGTFKLREKMNIEFLRGPLTAKYLSQPMSKAITDPAILMPKLRPVEKSGSSATVSFMPHITMDSPALKRIVLSIGMDYISPSDQEQDIFTKIANSQLLITSAMHGAIFADSYRTPWIPVVTSHQILSFKWQDWTQSMCLDYDAVELPPIWETQKSGMLDKLKTIVKTNKIENTLRKVATKTPTLSNDSVFESKTSDVLAAIESFKNKALS